MTVLFAHAGNHSGLGPWSIAGLAALGMVAGWYLSTAATQRRSDPRSWPTWRVLCFGVGTLFVAIALVPAWLPFDGHDFTQHMLQHLLLGMFGPLALALGSPVTLLLRSQPPARARRIARVLQARPLGLLSHPAVLVALTTGGLAAIYFTPLYGASSTDDLLHGAIHMHVFISGYLFAWVMAGADPVPRRRPVPRRLVYIGVAILGHAVIAQLIAAGIGLHVATSVGDRRAAGDLMYYGGDIAELLLALAVVTTWHRRPALSTYRMLDG